MTEVRLRKNQIAQAAEQLFSKRGYHATTVREIAAVYSGIPLISRDRKIQVSGILTVW